MYINSKKVDVKVVDVKKVDVKVVDVKDKLCDDVNLKMTKESEIEFEMELENDEELMNSYLYDDSDGYDDDGYEGECYDCLDL